MLDIELSKTTEIDFPKLMITRLGTIVLFTEPRVGTVLMSKKSSSIGKHVTNWHMESFQDLTQSLTLTNTRQELQINGYN